jgi:hypothetical protein
LIAAAAMSGSSILVTLNAQRARGAYGSMPVEPESVDAFEPSVRAA